MQLPSLSGSDQSRDDGRLKHPVLVESEDPTPGRMPLEAKNHGSETGCGIEVAKVVAGAGSVRSSAGTYQPKSM